MRTLALLSLVAMLSGCLVGEGIGLGFERMAMRHMEIMDPDTAWQKLVSEAGIAFEPSFVQAVLENDDGDDATVKEFLSGMRIAAALTDSFNLGKWKRDVAGRNYEVEIVTEDGTGMMVLQVISGGRARVGMRNPETGAVVWSVEHLEGMGIRPHTQQ